MKLIHISDQGPAAIPDTKDGRQLSCPHEVCGLMGKTEDIGIQCTICHGRSKHGMLCKTWAST